MKVLSLFDGMSCGQIALNRLGIKVDKYYASEIDKYAIKVTQANYPETIQVGDVCSLDPNDFKDVDLMLAGSPCQGFSFAGKQLAFDDPRSALFFEFIRLLKEIKPKYFLLENVKMKKEYLQVISEQVSACYPEIPFGIEPHLINSSLVSAQNRQRYYWTNIPNITQPEERGIVLRDILEDQVGSEHYAGDNLQENYQGGNQLNPNYKSQANTIHDTNKKSATLCAGTHGYANGYIGDKHKPVKDTERNRRHKRNLDQKSLCMTATMYKGAGNNGMTIVPQKMLDDNLPKMTTKDEKAYCLTTRYTAAEPKNSMERKQRTMVPVAEGQELPEDISLVYDNEGKSHKPIRVGMNVEQVKVRKHEVDIKALQNLLRQSKADAKKTNKLIAEETNLPITKVEHWFRTDKSFAIPSDDIWFKLKEVLFISDDTFDKQIMEFEYRDGVYESTQRVYGDHGKSPTLTASNADQLIQTSSKPEHIGTAVDVNGHDILKRVYSPDGKSPTVNTCQGGNREPKVVVQSYREVRTEEAKKARREVRKKTGKDYTPFRAKELQPRDDGKVGTVTPSLNNDHKISLTKDDTQEIFWRKLTPLECERLQTVPDNYTNHVSNTRRYQMLGNGWTIEVICHILKNMELDT